MSSVVEKKRTIALNVCATLFLLCLSVEAQQPKKVTRIGWLSEAYVRSQASPRNDAFLQGLQDLGYQEGKNMLIEHRSAGGKDERLARLAAELVRLNVDLIVALEPPAARAAKNATQTIPIVMRSTDDPVRAGLVASLAKPGGNITGVTSVATELIGKRLELFKEIARRNVRLGILWNPEFEGSEIAFDEAQSKARGLGMQVQSLEVRSPGDLEKSFRSAHGAGAAGVFPLRSPLIVRQTGQITELALKNRLPAVYDDREFVEAGGLMSYGTDLAALYRRAAYFVDKLLKGAKAADLPVEQPTKFELVINLKTAKQIGLTIPPNVLARADRVIK
jgi:putative ABC transport system substrate-binding protein